MKKYSLTTRSRREADNKIVRFKDQMDVLISSEEFIEKFRGYIEDIARYKTVKGHKYARSTEYAAIGIMDQNDLFQEAYLAFLEAYSNIDWDKVNGEGAVLWGFLKKSTILNFEKALRGRKDGIRVPEREMFGGSANTNLVTTLFSQLDKVFFRNQEDTATSKWDTDLTGYFLEVHMDDYLDFTRDGNRDYKKKERAIIKSIYGIDEAKKTYKEISEDLQVSQSTIRSVKERAIKRLQSEESKEKIANFLHEYRIQTNADTEKYRK